MSDQGPVMLRWLVFLVMGFSLLVIAGVGYVLMTGRTAPEKGNGSDHVQEGAGSMPPSVLKGNDGLEVQRDESEKRSDVPELRRMNKVGSVGGSGQRRIGENLPAYSSRYKPKHPGAGSQLSIDPSRPLKKPDRGKGETDAREVPDARRHSSIAKGSSGGQVPEPVTPVPKAENQDPGLAELGLGDTGQKQEFFCDLARQVREDCEALPRSPEALEFCLKANGYYTNSRHCGYRP